MLIIRYKINSLFKNKLKSRSKADLQTDNLVNDVESLGNVGIRRVKKDEIVPGFVSGPGMGVQIKRSHFNYYAVEDGFPGIGCLCILLRFP